MRQAPWRGPRPMRGRGDPPQASVRGDDGVSAPWHPLNWYAGWGLLLAAFATGALAGLGFHREDFLGGYGSFRRRLLRLGHIALAALGMLNLIYALSPWPAPSL